MCEGIPPGHDGHLAGETKMQANNNINSKAAALAAAKQAAVAKAAKLKAASKPAIETLVPVPANEATAKVEAALTDTVNALHGKEVEQPAQPVASKPVETAVEKKAVGGGLEAWREEQRKARMAREQRVQAIQHDIKDIKAKGAKMTDDDKAKLAALTADLAAAKGTVTGKAKAIKLLNEVTALFNDISAEANKHDITGFANPGIAASMKALASTTDELTKMFEATSWTRKPVGFAAKPKVAKVEIVIGTKVRIADKAKETYADVLDTAATYTVTKIVGAKAVILGDDNSKSLVQLNHLAA